ncbi:MAG TPA: GGDEF domain-containing protein [Vicinamibacterales bacterium]|jgi:diguanylate cyclase|nr:GGDEF domain-containing protein [Vicinamibacterales bacterium]
MTAVAEAPFVTFVERLIGVLSAIPPSAESKDTDAFLQKLEEYRNAVIDPTRRLEVPRVTEACVTACQRYFKLSKQYHHEREEELKELIGILRDAAKMSVGESEEFNAQVMASSQRFDNLARLDDIRDLKRQLVAEVSTLRHTVEEKQKRDERAYVALNSRVEALQSRLSEVEEEASTDPLTRIGNRGRFQRTLSRMMDQARANGTPLSLAMLDVDDFKIINDTHGHPIGDRVLLCTAQWLSKGLRQTDFVARYGGEEFAVLLANSTAGQVEDRLRQVLADIAASSYEYELMGKKERVRFTLSCGLTDLQPHEGEEEFIQRADEALYEAKRKGKNRVVARKRGTLKSLLSWA